MQAFKERNVLQGFYRNKTHLGILTSQKFFESFYRNKHHSGIYRARSLKVFTFRYFEDTKVVQGFLQKQNSFRDIKEPKNDIKEPKNNIKEPKNDIKEPKNDIKEPKNDIKEPKKGY